MRTLPICCPSSSTSSIETPLMKGSQPMKPISAEIGFIGCEPFINGVSMLLVLLDGQQIGKVRIVNEDARLLLRTLPAASIDRAYLLFPDPWPKRRHEGRRFVNPEALDLLA